MRRTFQIGAIAALSCWSISCSMFAVAATIVVGPGGDVATIRQAAQLAKDGDVVEIMPGEYRGDVAVWEQKKLSIRGTGARPVLVADGQSAESKAIWVIRNGDVSIDNIEFRGARVPDGNGAGIRFERGNLTIRNCRFLDNENGVLTANNEDAVITIESSEFGAAPHLPGLLKHLLYIGRVAKATITGNRFHHGYRGHLVKSRARENQIRYNIIVDGTAGQASYELEFPNGGIAYVIGNVIGQSATTDNLAIVSYGAEGRHWPLNGLYLSHNTLINDGEFGSRFLHVWDKAFGADLEIVAINNLLIGPGQLEAGPGARLSQNQVSTRSMLADPATLDFSLAPASALRGGAPNAGMVHGQSLAPTMQFAPPLGTRALGAVPRWSPGAFQLAP